MEGLDNHCNLIDMLHAYWIICNNKNCSATVLLSRLFLTYGYFWFQVHENGELKDVSSNDT